MTTTIRAILFGRFNSYGIHRFNFFLTAVFLNTPIPITLPCFLIPNPPNLFVSFVSLTFLEHISPLTRHMSIGTTLLSTDSLAMYGPCIKYEYILIIAICL